jgi:type VI protein secretion system component VasK
MHGVSVLDTARRSDHSLKGRAKGDSQMNLIFLTEFWEIMAWIAWFWLWMIFVFIFIWTFIDIFRRRDHHGWAKAGWALLILALPLLGVLIYLIVRPKDATAEQDAETLEAARRVASYSAAAEIERAQQLLASGAITQEEFERIKQNALKRPIADASTSMVF